MGFTQLRSGNSIIIMCMLVQEVTSSCEPNYYLLVIQRREVILLIYAHEFGSVSKTRLCEDPNILAMYYRNHLRLGISLTFMHALLCRIPHVTTNYKNDTPFIAHSRWHFAMQSQRRPLHNHITQYQYSPLAKFIYQQMEQILCRRVKGRHCCQLSGGLRLSRGVLSAGWPELR